MAGVERTDGLSFWDTRRVLVTGATGFIGSHLVEALLQRGAYVRATARTPPLLADTARDPRVEYVHGDLRSREFALRACDGMDVAINLAAEVAGVEYNSAHPGTIFTNNVATGLTILDAAAHTGVERFLCVSSACVYRRFCTVPTPEDEGFVDDPEPSNLGYGWAKRVLEVHAHCYARQFPMKIGIARPYNAYGPHDDFEWETSHVIPALIRKVVEGQDPIVVWGDGTQTRSFLYVSDFVQGLMAVAERYAECDPVNIGTDEEITVRALAETIAELAGSRARPVFDTTRPSGQPRRNGDFSKAREKAGFAPTVSLREGLARTIEWYKAARIG